LSIVKKTFGNNTYQYEVAWDPKTKKHTWKYVGKVLTDGQLKAKLRSVGIEYTNAEKEGIREMLDWVLARSKHQSGHRHGKFASLLIERLGLGSKNDALEASTGGLKNG